MNLHFEKKGIRALGIAESFRPERSKRSILAGIVMRRDLIIDGVILGTAKLKGLDATDAICNMFSALSRNDINIIMIGGAIISLYNIIDIDEVHRRTQVPSLSVTYEPSEGIERSIKRHFPRDWRKRIELYRRLGPRERARLKTGHEVFIRPAGLSPELARRALNIFTQHGAVPEPIRVARLVARAYDELKRSLRHPVTFKLS